MQALSSTYPADEVDTAHPLILNERTSAVSQNESILFQQLCLELTNDRGHIVLRRYFERYSPTSSHWVEYIHTIPIAEFTHWIMANGDLRIECSEDLPASHSRA
jgi:hypothetical protein